MATALTDEDTKTQMGQCRNLIFHLLVRYHTIQLATDYLYAILLLGLLALEPDANVELPRVFLCVPVRTRVRSFLQFRRPQLSYDFLLSHVVSCATV